MKNPHSRLRAKAAPAFFALTVIAVSGCQTPNTWDVFQPTTSKEVSVSTNSAYKNPEIKKPDTIIEVPEPLAIKEQSEVAEASNSQPSPDFKEFRDQLKADTGAYPELSVDVVVVIGELRQKGIGCNAPEWSKAEQLVEGLEGLSDNRSRVIGKAGRFYRLREVQKTNLQWFNTFTETAITSRFAFADIALAKGCLDTADTYYRHIMKRYTGSGYAAHRERAKIGIDDVRAKRANQ